MPGRYAPIRDYVLIRSVRAREHPKACLRKTLLKRQEWQASRKSTWIDDIQPPEAARP